MHSGERLRGAGSRCSGSTGMLAIVLQQLPRATRIVFVQRYWYLNSIAEIAQKNGMGESKVKMILLRTRKKLKAALETEGISI